MATRKELGLELGERIKDEKGTLAMVLKLENNGGTVVQYLEERTDKGQEKIVIGQRHYMPPAYSGFSRYQE